MDADATNSEEKFLGETMSLVPTKTVLGRALGKRSLLHFLWFGNPVVLLEAVANSTVRAPLVQQILVLQASGSGWIEVSNPLS